MLNIVYRVLALGATHSMPSTTKKIVHLQKKKFRQEGLWDPNVFFHKPQKFRRKVDIDRTHVGAERGQAGDTIVHQEAFTCHAGPKRDPGEVVMLATIMTEKNITFDELVSMLAENDTQVETLIANK